MAKKKTKNDLIKQAEERQSNSDDKASFARFNKEYAQMMKRQGLYQGREDTVAYQTGGAGSQALSSTSRMILNAEYAPRKRGSAFNDNYSQPVDKYGPKDNSKKSKKK